MNTVSASHSVVISYLSSIYMGLARAAIITVVYDLVMAFYVLPDSCHILNMKVKNLFYHVNEDANFLYDKVKKAIQ